MSTAIPSPDTSGWHRFAHCGCCGRPGGEPAGEVRGIPLLRCGGCGARRFAVVAPAQELYADGYHDGANPFGWDYTADGEAGYLGAIADATLEWVEARRRPGRLVDVGGGLGYFAAAAARRGWEAELVEPVPAAAGYARDRLGLTAHCGDDTILAELPGRYDVVAFVHAVEHIHEARDALARARGALAPGGHLFVEVPNHGSLSRRLQGDEWMGWQPGEHVYVFDRASLARLVEAAGYEVVDRRTFVPGWSGMAPDGYAHLLGLQRALRASARLKQRAGARAGGDGGAAGAAVERANRPIDSLGGWRRRLFGDAFDVLARAETRAGLGTNLQLLARPR